MDLKEEQGFNCLIDKPARIQIRGLTTRTLIIDILLPNKPEMFKRSGTYNSELSDHALIYGIIKEKVKHHRGKVIKFRSAKHFNPENFKEHLSSVPWHVGDIFKSVDDQCRFYPNKDSQIGAKEPGAPG